jgi:hypothetical protein
MKKACYLWCGLVTAHAAQPDAFVAPENDICDVLGPVYSGLNGWILIGIAFAALSLLIIMVVWLWRRYRKKQAVCTLPLSPYEVAEQQLATAQSHMADGQDALFALHLSQALREYLARAWEMPAPECTTEEFLAYLMTDHALVENHKAVLVHILQATDLAKFAKATLSHESRDALLLQARAWLQQVHQAQQQSLLPKS